MLISALATGQPNNIFLISSAVLILLGLFLFINPLGLESLSIMREKADFTFTQSNGDFDPLMIGENALTANPLSFTCQYKGDVVKYPDNQECWQSTINYNGLRYVISPDQKILIDDKFYVQMNVISARFDEIDSGKSYSADYYTVRYEFFLKNFSIESSISSNLEYTLNSDDELVLEISNKLATFPEDTAGLWTRTSHDLLERGSEWEEVPFEIRQGTNKYLISPDTTELGKTTLEIQPFVKIKADKVLTLYQENPVKITYKVVLEESKIDQMTSSSQNEIELSLWDKFISLFITFFGWSN